MAALDEESDYIYLISACFHGEVEFVKYIVSQASEVLGDSCQAITAFMMACSIGNCEIVEYLLTSGMDANVVDMTAFKGVTGLHRSVSTGKLECIELLVRHGARLDIKHKGMTPLLQASAEGRAKIVQYFIELPTCTAAAKIEALELLGATFIDDQDDMKPSRAVGYWSKSLTERGKADVPPKSKETHPGFGVVEFSTVEELYRIRSSEDQIEMQSLLIRERIFGAQNSHTSTYVIRRAHEYSVQRNFNASIKLLTYILDIQQKSDSFCNWTLKEFCSHVDSLSQVMFEGSPVKYEHLMAVFMKMLDVVEHEMRPQKDPEQPWNCTSEHSDLCSVLHSLSILAQLQPTVSEEERLEFRRVVEKIVRLNVRDLEGYTLLHLACLCESINKSPLAVLQLLLEARADACAVGPFGETPLHSVATNEHHDQHEMIQLLLSSGAHFDACNAEGKCFTELLDSDNKFIVETPLEYCSLQCLSAKAVKKYSIAFESKVPSLLSQFIKMH